jgi:hypothetical protein
MSAGRRVSGGPRRGTQASRSLFVCRARATGVSPETPVQIRRLLLFGQLPESPTNLMGTHSRCRPRLDSLGKQQQVTRRHDAQVISAERPLGCEVVYESSQQCAQCGGGQACDAGLARWSSLRSESAAPRAPSANSPRIAPGKTMAPARMPASGSRRPIGIGSSGTQGLSRMRGEPHPSDLRTLANRFVRFVAGKPQGWR